MCSLSRFAARRSSSTLCVQKTATFVAADGRHIWMPPRRRETRHSKPLLVEPCGELSLVVPRRGPPQTPPRARPVVQFHGQAFQFRDVPRQKGMVRRADRFKAPTRAAHAPKWVSPVSLSLRVLSPFLKRQCRSSARVRRPTALLGSNMSGKGATLYPATNVCPARPTEATSRHNTSPKPRARRNVGELNLATTKRGATSRASGCNRSDKGSHAGAELDNAARCASRSRCIEHVVHDESPDADQRLTGSDGQSLQQQLEQLPNKRPAHVFKIVVLKAARNDAHRRLRLPHCGAS